MMDALYPKSVYLFHFGLTFTLLFSLVLDGYMVYVFLIIIKEQLIPFPFS